MLYNIGKFIVLHHGFFAFVRINLFKASSNVFRGQNQSYYINLHFYIIQIREPFDGWSPSHYNVTIVKND